jgi:hypothetical protein
MIWIDSRQIPALIRGGDFCYQRLYILVFISTLADFIAKVDDGHEDLCSGSNVPALEPGQVSSSVPTGAKER